MGWNSRIIRILKYDWCLIELWCDVKDSAPFYTIGDSINQNVIKLLYTNWSLYSPSVQRIDKGIASNNKMKIPTKKYQI